MDINSLQSQGQNILDSVTGSADKRKASEAYGDQGAIANQQYQETQAINDKLKKLEEDRIQAAKNQRDTYNTGINNAFTPYVDKTRSLQGEVNRDRTAQQRDYQGLDQNINALMGRADADQRSGLTIAEAMDPNNRIAKGQQDLYRGQGKQYQDFARKQLQMPGNQIPQGANPALFNSVMSSNAGQAYANTQQRMDQMRNQGYMQGIVESQKSSSRGMDANARARALAGQRQGMQGAQMQSQGALRQEAGGYAGQRQGALLDRRERLFNPGVQNMQKQFSTDQAGRNVAAINQRTAGVTGASTGQAQTYAQSTGFLPAIASAAGGYAGASRPAQPAAVQKPAAGYGQTSAGNPYTQNQYSGGYSQGIYGTPR